MSKEQTEPIKENLAEINNVFKIGSLGISAALTALQIVFVVGENESETIKL